MTNRGYIDAKNDLRVGGSLTINVVTVAGSVSLNQRNSGVYTTIYAVDTIALYPESGTAGASTINLMAASSAPGKVVFIKDRAGGAGTANRFIGITVDVGGTVGINSVDGSTSTTISQAYGCVQIFSDGKRWCTLGKTNTEANIA